MYFFPTPAVTNHHKLIFLKQHKHIILHFWRSEFQNQIHWAKLQMLTRLCSFGGFRRKSISLAFVASRGHLHFWAHGPILHLQSQDRIFSPSDLCIYPYIFSLSLTLMLPLLSYKDRCDSIELLRIIQDDLPNSIFLIATTYAFYLTS